MNTQTISRKHLKLIYNSDICSGWKNKITETLKAQSFEDVITVDNKDLNTAYSDANASQKKMIEKYFIITIPKKISDQISNFYDILKKLGRTSEQILLYPYFGKSLTKNQISQNGLAKIQCITEVYNDGTILDWDNNNQYKYYPYFRKISGGWALDGVDCCDVYAAYPARAHYFTIKIIYTVPIGKK